MSASCLFNPNRAILHMLFGALCFSAMGACAKQLSQSLPFMQVVFARAGVNLLLILPWMLARRTPVVGKNHLLLLTRSLAGFIALSCGFYATSQIALADAAILHHTSVIFIVLLSPLTLGESPSRLLVAAVVTGMLGVGLIIKPSLEFLNIPGLVGAAGGFFSAIALTSIKKLHASESSNTIVLHFAFYATLLSGILCAPQFQMPTLEQFFLLLAMGIAGALGQVCMTSSYRYGPATLVSPFIFAGVLFSAVWGFTFWGELPDVWSILGGTLLVGSGVAILRTIK